MEKIKVSVCLDSLNDVEFAGSVEKCIQHLKDKKKEWEEKGFENIQISWEHDYDWTDVQVWGERLENDAEFNKRKKAEEQKLERARKKLERERAKYEELK